MQKRTKLQQRLLVTGCAAAVLASAGCRSSRPSWNLFSWRNTPSAEALAGKGPSTTYPAPPSEAATPESIASVAGGTSAPPEKIAAVSPESPITGFEAAAKAADVASASPPNLSAARANGFNLASNRTPSGGAAVGPSGGAAADTPTYLSAPETRLDNKSAVPAVPAGYRFGTNTAAPDAPPKASIASGYSIAPSNPAPSAGSGSTSSVAPSGYAMPDASPAPTVSQTSGLGMPGALPAAPQTATQTAGAFAMPELPTASPTSHAAGSSTNPSSVTNAQPFTPKATEPVGPVNAPAVAGASMSLPTGPESSPQPEVASPPAMNTPSFSTASAELSPRASAEMDSRSSSGGYAPGSTSASGGYPTTSGYPSTGTSGSYYR